MNKILKFLSNIKNEIFAILKLKIFYVMIAVLLVVMYINKLKTNTIDVKSDITSTISLVEYSHDDSKILNSNFYDDLENFQIKQINSLKYSNDIDLNFNTFKDSIPKYKEDTSIPYVVNLARPIKYATSVSRSFMTSQIYGYETLQNNYYYVQNNINLNQMFFAPGKFKLKINLKNIELYAGYVLVEYISPAGIRSETIYPVLKGQVENISGDNYLNFELNKYDFNRIAKGITIVIVSQDKFISKNIGDFSISDNEKIIINEPLYFPQEIIPDFIIDDVYKNKIKEEFLK